MCPLRVEAAMSVVPGSTESESMYGSDGGGVGSGACVGACAGVFVCIFVCLFVFVCVCVGTGGSFRDCGCAVFLDAADEMRVDNAGGGGSCFGCPCVFVCFCERKMKFLMEHDGPLLLDILVKMNRALPVPRSERMFPVLLMSFGCVSVSGIECHVMRIAAVLIARISPVVVAAMSSKEDLLDELLDVYVLYVLDVLL